MQASPSFVKPGTQKHPVNAAVPSGEKLLAGQSAQLPGLVPPSAAPYVPIGQAMQSAARALPVAGRNLPTSQLVQASVGTAL